MFKSIAAVLLLVFAGGYFVGAFGPQAYSRTVSRPPAQVMAALEDLDLTAQPGAPGSTAQAAGGVKPLFRLQRDGNRMTWWVMSGDKVATAMTATFEPADDGRATLIRTSVERGDAPDDFVSPAFRSKGLTMALFAMALEGEVNKLVQPAAASAEDCQKLLDGFTDHNLAAIGERPEGFRQGMAEGAKNIMRLHAMEAEMRRNGCDTNQDGDFQPVQQQMAPADPVLAGGGVGTMSDNDPVRAPGPGQPMLDPTPSR
ncbi:MAG TPA: hypothetical protein VFQ64_00835 [Sphingomonas sp.]|jgi:hypothetical protein|nr:hypothetical protein [Sphingomonas sp.]